MREYARGECQMSDHRPVRAVFDIEVRGFSKVAELADIHMNDLFRPRSSTMNGAKPWKRKCTCGG